MRSTNHTICAKQKELTNPEESRSHVCGEIGQGGPEVARFEVVEGLRKIAPDGCALSHGLGLVQPRGSLEGLHAEALAGVPSVGAVH